MIDPKPGKQSYAKNLARAQGGEGNSVRADKGVGRYAIVTFLGPEATGVAHEVREIEEDSVTLACKTVDSALGPGRFGLRIPSSPNSQAPEDLLALEVLNEGVEASQHELNT
ncbi:hypothetical protein FRB94_006939 [Tulasnella sp. JGI-2019a]|nr:hypothetical protein FRB93_001389 [Tulasnella sp. JGI-2019a]KAG8998283.1 hypothetical protein FRB94_006939 [Tulasnella sp. JGI-2019a]KAG9031265.1 hypothetical protein FRB95_002905 [Tulasnella sp. JGI-2019a]